MGRDPRAEPPTILCSITGYGQGGPSASQAGHDIGYLARAGVLGHSGEADRPPLPLGVQVADLAAARCQPSSASSPRCASATARPRRPVRDSAARRCVDDRCHPALLLLDGAATMAGHEAPRGAAPLGGAAIACYRTYACADGHVTLGALEPKFLARLLRRPRRDDLLPHPGAAPSSPIGRELEALFAARTREEWATFAAEHDCCLEPVLTPAEAFAAAQSAAADGALPGTFAVPAADGTTVSVPAPGSDSAAHRSPLPRRRRAPASTTPLPPPGPRPRPRKLSHDRSIDPSRDLAGVTDARRLTDDQQAVADGLAEFCEGEAGTREQRERLTDGGSTFHHQETYRKLADLGYVGACVPEEYGGGGGDIVDMCVFLEEYRLRAPADRRDRRDDDRRGRRRAFGTEEQSSTTSGGIAAGDPFAIAMSEPDPAATWPACARRRPSTVTSRRQRPQDLDHLRPRSRRDPPHRPLGAERAQARRTLDGVHPARDTRIDIRPIDTMGGNEQCDVFFTDVTVPAANARDPWAAAGASSSRTQRRAADHRAIMLGIGRRAFDDTLAYIREREQFGKKIGSFQAMKHRVSDLATELRCAELRVYDVRPQHRHRPPSPPAPEASMAKLKVSEVAKKIALEGVQMMGGYGYASE